MMSLRNRYKKIFIFIELGDLYVILLIVECKVLPDRDYQYNYYRDEIS